jgi:hypothetical protein
MASLSWYLISLPTRRWICLLSGIFDAGDVDDLKEKANSGIEGLRI